MEIFYEAPNAALKARRFSEYRNEIIEPFFPSDYAARILDLGAGHGLFLDACRKLGYEQVEGVEQEKVLVEYAQKEFGLTLAQTDLFAFLESVGDGTYDVVTAFNIIEHVKKDRVEHLLSLIRRKLKRNGLFIMEVPNADSPLGVHTYFSDLTHEFAFSKKLGLRLLSMAGFERVSVRYEPNLRNPLIKVAQRILAKVIGFDPEAMFSGNITLVGHAAR